MISPFTESWFLEIWTYLEVFKSMEVMFTIDLIELKRIVVFSSPILNWFISVQERKLIDIEIVRYSWPFMVCRGMKLFTGLSFIYNYCYLYFTLLVLFLYSDIHLFELELHIFQEYLDFDQLVFEFNRQ